MFSSNYGRILYRFRDKARYWLKIAIFHTPVHSTSPSGGSPQSIAVRFDMEKLERCGYPMVKKFDDMFSRFDIVSMYDIQTDRRTYCNGIVCTCAEHQAA